MRIQLRFHACLEPWAHQGGGPPTPCCPCSVAVTSLPPCSSAPHLQGVLGTAQRRRPRGLETGFLHSAQSVGSSRSARSTRSPRSPRTPAWVGAGPSLLRGTHCAAPLWGPLHSSGRPVCSPSPGDMRWLPVWPVNSAPVGSSTDRSHRSGNAGSSCNHQRVSVDMKPPTVSGRLHHFPPAAVGTPPASLPGAQVGPAPPSRAPSRWAAWPSGARPTAAA